MILLKITVEMGSVLLRDIQKQKSRVGSCKPLLSIYNYHIDSRLYILLIPYKLSPDLLLDAQSFAEHDSEYCPCNFWSKYMHFNGWGTD